MKKYQGIIVLTLTALICGTILYVVTNLVK